MEGHHRRRGVQGSAVSGIADGELFFATFFSLVRKESGAHGNTRKAPHRRSSAAGKKGMRKESGDGRQAPHRPFDCAQDKLRSAADMKKEEKQETEEAHILGFWLKINEISTSLHHLEYFICTHTREDQEAWKAQQLIAREGAVGGVAHAK